jgi:hypothetical protein
MNFQDIFEKKYKVSSKSVQWKPSYSMRKDGRADMTKLMVAFRNFANASENFLLTAVTPPVLCSGVLGNKSHVSRRVRKIAKNIC